MARTLFGIMLLCAIPIWAVRAQQATNPAAEPAPPAVSPAAADTEPAAAADTEPAPPEVEKSESSNPAGANSEDDNSLPTLEAMPIPTAAELLHQPPRTWVVLKRKDEVLVTEPVEPRPNTLETMQARLDASYKWPRAVTTEEAEAQREKRNRLHYLYLVLPDDDLHQFYRLDMKYIRQVIHHEDLTLKRVHLLLDEGQLAEAYELLLVLQRNTPGWPGYDEAHNRLLFLDARARQSEKPQEALALFAELHGRKQDYPQLSQELGRTVDSLIATAVEQHDLPRARHFLVRLRQLEPRHAVVIRWTDTWKAEALEQTQLARAASTSGRHDEALALVSEAARIWPSLPELEPLHLQLASRFQKLKVGVLELPVLGREGEAPAEPVTAPHAASRTFGTELKICPELNAADIRGRQLMAGPLFEVVSFNETARYQSRIFEEWEPADLGRSMVFSIRQQRSPWESQPSMTAGTVVAALADRINPASTSYNERLAALIETIAVQSPLQFTIEFSRAPLRTESLLRLVDGKQSAGSASPTPKVATTGSRFQIHEHDEHRIAYRRTVLQPDGRTQYYVAEIEETRYASHDAAMQALLRGEVSMLPQIQLGDVRALKDDSRFVVLQYALPATHVLQFHPQSPPARSSELRRALSAAIPRREILQGEFLPTGASDWGRLTTAPFPRNSPAYYSLTPEPRFDPLLGLSLTLAARQQLAADAIPTLKMLCPQEPQIRAAANRLLDAWKLVGLQVELLDAETSLPEEGCPEWDIAYTVVRMADPTAELWPFLTGDPSAGTRSLAVLPVWLRQHLVALDEAGDWDTATSLSHTLHEQMWNNLQVIPLWELDEFLVLRQTVRGFPQRPIHPYQDVERWSIRPWYSETTPGIATR